MEDYERSRIERLLDRDAELRTLWSAHLDLEGRIADLEELLHLTPAEELVRKRLQKQKLVGRDQIARVVARHAPH